LSKSSRLKTTAALAAAAIAVVGAWEGVKLVAYRDIVGVPTVCFGETRGVKMGDRYTMEQCQVMLGEALMEFEAGMRRCMKEPDGVPDGAYVAVLSWSYNVGTGAACKSTLMRKLNAGDIRGACNELPKWNRAGGRAVKGLSNRREAERKLCLEGLR
jgi:lysozyme